MNKRIAVVGAGAIGGYAGAHMARAGHDVTLIDAWPAHVEAIRKEGLHISGMTPAEMIPYMESQKAKWAPLVAASGVTVE